MTFEKQNLLLNVKIYFLINQNCFLLEGYTVLQTMFNSIKKYNLLFFIKINLGNLRKVS